MVRIASKMEVHDEKDRVQALKGLEDLARKATQLWVVSTVGMAQVPRPTQVRRFSCATEQDRPQH